MVDGLFATRLALAILSAFTIACARSDALLDTRGPDVLWLPQGTVLEHDGAEPLALMNGRSIYADGSSAVVFSISAERQHVSDLLVRHFASEGWRQRKTQRLNPSLPTSFDGGWERHCGCVFGQDLPHDPYFKWRGEWENDRGDQVSYAIEGVGNHLRGYAAYRPHGLL
jgi:hypothetical protein